MPMAQTAVANVLMTCASDQSVGGVQLVVRDLVRSLHERGREVHLVYQAPLPRVGLARGLNTWGHSAFYCAMPAIVKNSVLVSVPVFLLYVPIAFFNLATLIRKKKIDVVNCHYLAPYFIHLVIAARLLRVPVVVSVHGADIDGYAESDRFSRLLCRLIMRGSQRIVACSAALARQTIEVFPDVRRKVTFVHNGVDPSRYAKIAQPNDLPQRFVLSVCRHVRKKGIDTLLRAFALVVREAPEMSLFLAGGGPLLEEHKALARALGVERHIIFTGEVAHAEVSQLFAGCDVFVLPSRSEPFGLVLLEAAYYSKGIVCTRVGGVPEIITNGVDGVLVEPDDPASMATQILALLNNRERATQLGRRAFQTLTKRFLWSQRVLDYIAVYEGRRPLTMPDAEPKSRQVPLLSKSVR
jgi:glycosyltransferase involved in cell wall biosynthesis